VPGTEVLRGDLQTGELLEVRVDVGAAHVVPRGPLPVREEAVAAASAAQQRGRPAAGGGVGDGLDDLPAVLAGVREQDGAALTGGVLAEQGGQAVAVVQLGVLVAAYAEEAEVEEAHGGGEDPLAGQAAIAEVPLDGLAYGGQGLGDVEDVAVLGPLLLGAEPRVVEVLAAAGGVGADRLEVAVGPGADPHVAPGGRNDERADTGQFGGVAQRAPLGVEVAEAAPVSPAGVAGVDGPAVVKTQPRLLGREPPIVLVQGRRSARPLHERAPLDTSLLSRICRSQTRGVHRSGRGRLPVRTAFSPHRFPRRSR
jgi:hypothetical protein